MVNATNMQRETVSKALVVNGETLDVAVETLAELIGQLGYGDQRIATAVNGSFVAGDARNAYQLHDGDQVEVVAPRQGG